MKMCVCGGTETECVCDTETMWVNTSVRTSHSPSPHMWYTFALLIAVCVVTTRTHAVVCCRSTRCTNVRPQKDIVCVLSPCWLHKHKHKHIQDEVEHVSGIRVFTTSSVVGCCSTLIRIMMRMVLLPRCLLVWCYIHVFLVHTRFIHCCI